MLYFLDGKFTKKEELKISVDDRGYYFGDGIYEVIKVYGGELFTAQEHIDRLFNSAEKIKLSLSQTKEQVLDIVKELISVNNLVDGHVYLQITRGSYPRQHHFPLPAVEPIILAYAVRSSRPLMQMEKGVSVKSVADIRWLRCDIKSLNLLGSVLAKEEAHAAGFHEAILHRDGVVTEGSSTNMFGVKDGIIYTHPVTNLILNGITRMVVFNICYEYQIPIVEKAFTLDEAMGMDEMFLTSTTSEVTPIIAIDSHIIGTGERGEIVKKLQEAFSERIPLSTSEII